jgi:hypothetical protein
LHHHHGHPNAYPKGIKERTMTLSFYNARGVELIRSSNSQNASMLWVPNLLAKKALKYDDKKLF